MAYIYDLVDSWNSAGTTFTAIKMNVTDTASSASSLLMDLQVGGSSKFNVDKAGRVTAGPSGFAASFAITNSYNAVLWNGAQLGFSASSGVNPAAFSDTILTRRGAANIRLGAADAAAPVAQTLSVQSVAAGTANTAGANFTITGSQGTGTGAGGSIIFQVAPAGSTGSTVNPLVDALSINSARQSIFAAGSKTSPSIGFSGFTGGIYGRASGFITFTTGNVENAQLGGNSSSFLGGIGLSATAGNGGDLSVSGPDVFVYRDDSNVLAQRNSTAAQTFRIYETFTDASNYSRAFFRVAGSIGEIGTEAAGTGTVRPLYFSIGGATAWYMSTSRHLLAGTDNTFDIGASAGNRPRDLYVANSITTNLFTMGATATLIFNARARINSPTANDIRLWNSTSDGFGLLQFGGTTSSFPALKRSGAALQVRLADDSADAAISASTFTASSNAVNISALASTGYSLTGSSAVSAVDIAGTWNTTGAPTGIKLNITDVASSASSLLMDLQTNGNSRFKVAKDGAIEARTIATTSNSVNLSAISSTGHSLTGSSSVSMVDLAGTWNTTGTPSAFKMNITDTASNSGSLLMDIQVGGSPVFRMAKNGGLSVAQGTVLLGMPGNVGLHLANDLFTLRFGGALDLILARDAANTLAQRNGVNAQGFNIYNTYTDASNYERGFIRWSSNVLYLGTEKAGTGTARSFNIMTDGVTRMSFASDNTVANITTTILTVGDQIRFGSATRLTGSSNGILRLSDSAETGFGRLQFGGISSSYPALRRSVATLQARLADDSGFTNMEAAQFVTPTQTLTDGATITFNADLSAVAEVTLAGTGRTLTPSNLKAGGTYLIFVKQDGTGNRTITTWTNFKWVNGVAPVLSTAANAVDIISGVSDGTFIYASMQQGFA